MRLTVPDTIKNEDLLNWLVSQLANLSYSHARRLLKKGAIRINGVVAPDVYNLAGGEEIEIPWPRRSSLKPVPMALDVLYEDHSVVVINKSAGIVVHPSPGHPYRTIINGLVARYPESKPYSSRWPRLVHRLDRDTSGVLIAARSISARHFLQKQFSERTTEKEYLALVLGHPKSTRGTIKGPIGRHQSHWRKWAVVPNGRPSTTHYEVLECFANSSLLLVQPITGRTHQIRVHLKAIGLPIAGDQLYAPHRREIPQLSRQFLHAARLSITTPDGQRRTFEAPLPAELEAVLHQLRITNPANMLQKLSSFPAKIEPIHKMFWFTAPIEPTHQSPARLEFRSFRSEGFSIKKRHKGSPERHKASPEGGMSSSTTRSATSQRVASFIEEVERTEGLDRLGEIELMEGVEDFEDFEDFEGVEGLEDLEDFENFEDFEDFQTRADNWLSEVLWERQEG